MSHKPRKPPLLAKLAARAGERWRAWQTRRGAIAFARPATAAAPPPRADDITAILTVYKRPGYAKQQIAALRAQTCPPAQIWLWCNAAGAPIADFSDSADRVVVSNHNWKFFGRFALATMAQTRYIALFDDDILPQPEWFANCLRAVAEGKDGILGGSGVLLPAAGGYSSQNKVGWNGKHSHKTEEVDLAGHAWFFDKRHLAAVWQEDPYSWDNGEDIHFSAMAQKYGGVKTYIPPHPPNQPSLWSCDPQFGKIAGGGAAATYKTATHAPIRDAAVRHYRANGWKIVSDGDN